MAVSASKGTTELYRQAIRRKLSKVSTCLLLCALYYTHTLSL